MVHRAAGADIFDHLDGMLTFYNWVIHEETAAWILRLATVGHVLYTSHVAKWVIGMGQDFLKTLKKKHI